MLESWDTSVGVCFVLCCHVILYDGQDTLTLSRMGIGDYYYFLGCCLLLQMLRQTHARCPCVRVSLASHLALG
jgi:hypothetical protein